jgi:hypothetical protein
MLLLDQATGRQFILDLPSDQPVSYHQYEEFVGAVLSSRIPAVRWSSQMDVGNDSQLVQEISAATYPYMVSISG